MDAPASTPDFTLEPDALRLPRMLGRLPATSTRKALQFADFFKYLQLPASSNTWAKRQPVPIRSFGNLAIGDCTIAKQAVASTRFERLEQRKTITISDDEVARVYFAMTSRLYGGGDTGAFETDALDNWRNPETTFKDTDGHPYTIDAYLGINPKNQNEVRAAIALSAAKGIAVCFNLPSAIQGHDDKWEGPPAGQAPIGDWLPGSWGGHSVHCYGYTAEGLLLDMTWDIPPLIASWDFVATYMDEAHLIIDSVDTWKHKAKAAVGTLKLAQVVEAVNDVSRTQIGDRA